MTQYFAHQNADVTSRRVYPYLLDIQSPLLEGSRTTVVVPLQLAHHFSPQRNSRLNPLLHIDGNDYALITQQIFSVPQRFLGAHAQDCRSETNTIVAAIDCLLSGI